MDLTPFPFPIPFAYLLSSHANNESFGKQKRWDLTQFGYRTGKQIVVIILVVVRMDERAKISKSHSKMAFILPSIRSASSFLNVHNDLYASFNRHTLKCKWNSIEAFIRFYCVFASGLTTSTVERCLLLNWISLISNNELPFLPANSATLCASSNVNGLKYLLSWSTLLWQNVTTFTVHSWILDFRKKNEWKPRWIV